MSWCIYKHTNQINGKVYIGQTCQTPERRWREGEGYEGCPKFYNAIKKYGWINFSHDIIESELQTIEEANDREIYWIAFYNSFNEGYNMTEGGGNGHRNSENYGKHLRKPVLQFDASLNLVAEYESAHSAADITGIDRAQICRCCNNSFMSEDKSHNTCSAGGYYWIWKGSWYEGWQPRLPKDKTIYNNGKPVFQIDQQTLTIIQEWNSQSAASRALSIPSNNISLACKQEQYISAGGFYWCLVEDYSSNWKPRINKNKAKQRIIRCKNTGDVFTISQEAANFGGLKTPDSIYKVCLGKQKTAGRHPVTKERLEWEYITRENHE
jgi:group I intron endonuclease